MFRVFFLFFFFFVGFCYADEAGVSLTIEVRNIKEIKGKIHIGVFASSEDYVSKKNQVRKGSYTVTDKNLVVTYQGLLKGEYAVLLFQDKNDNEINDANALGIPLEPFGISNNVHPGFTLPAFNKAKFKIEDKPVTLSIDLQMYQRRWSVGLASITSATPYVGKKIKFLPLPAIAYQGDKLDIFGHIIRYSFYHDSHWNFALSGRLNFDGYNEDDDAYLNGLRDRQYVFEVGAEMKYSFYNDYFASLDVYGDPFGISYGMQGSLEIGKIFGNEKWKITPTVGLDWQNRNYGDYYYGVQASQSNADRPEYHPDYAFNPVVSCSYLHFLGDSWASYFKIRFSYLNEELQASPLVEKEYSCYLIAAFAYRF